MHNVNRLQLWTRDFVYRCAIGRPALNSGTQFRFCSEFCQRALSKQISETRRASEAETIRSRGKLRNYYSAAETAIWSTAKFIVEHRIANRTDIRSACPRENCSKLGADICVKKTSRERRWRIFKNPTRENIYLQCEEFFSNQTVMLIVIEAEISVSSVASSFQDVPFHGVEKCSRMHAATTQ